MQFPELDSANSDPIYLGHWTAKSNFFMLPLQSGILQAPLTTIAAQQHQLFSSGHYRSRCQQGKAAAQRCAESHLQILLH